MISLSVASLIATQKSDAQIAGNKPFVWEAANLYFLMTDRFNNGDKSNDLNFDRTRTPGMLRGFQGGDIKGITAKINEGYFTKLGINAIWLTPIVEQIHDGTDEGTGVSYGFHGYWTRDWTKLDPNFGTEKDLAELVETAHKNGIRILLDAVINHTGPVTQKDSVWPSDWVRTEPVCNFSTFEGNTKCALVQNLPDILTESNENVELPAFLVEKWKAEGRYDQEIKELNAFFAKTGYPKAPRYYIMKWLTDYILDYGIDGYRADTVKHTEESVWAEFKTQCNVAFADWKKKNPSKVLDDNDFYLIAEVYNFGISSAKAIDFGDRKVNYYDYGFNNVINFEFKWDAQKDYEFLFSKYSAKLNNELEGFSVLNYLSSHDDSQPFDAKREKGIEAGTKLLLTPGISQVYYGDESNRSLVVPGTQGDATLRSPMNWEAIANDADTQKVLEHWQKLGQFRANHVSVGAGVHQKLSAAPYVFSRGYETKKIQDRVVIGLDMPLGKKRINVKTLFKNGTKVRDAYSGKTTSVKGGFVEITSDFNIILLEQL